MSKSKHTEGPWNWTEGLTESGKLDGKFTIYDNNETLGYMYRDIARLPKCKSKAERKANARLISAAPEMLETLKKVEVLITPDDERSHKRDLELIETALMLIQAVISKAEGKED